MDNELLEKMWFLYDAGFEPDRWYSEINHTLSDKKQAKMVGLLRPGEKDSEKFEFYYEHDQPYFTESRLWSLLPNRIGNNFLLITDIYIHYKNYDPREDAPDLISIDVSKFTLLEALLDLTIWAVKEGYLKV
jgi:hypothetical protein